MKALVTGATGLIGSNVARALLKRGHQVRTLIRKGSDTSNIDDIEVEHVLGDIRDPDSLGAAIGGCDAVFHVAALYSFWEPEPEIFYDINVKGTINVLEAALNAKVDRVIYTSTVATIAPSSSKSLSNEECWATDDGIYGNYKRTKVLAERKAFELHKKGLPVVVVNPTTTIGPWDNKPTPSGKIIVDFMLGRMPAYMETGFNVVDVEDVAEGHVLAMEKGIPGQRYILGNRNMTLQEFLGRLGKATGRKAPKIKIPTWFALGMAYIDTMIEGSILSKEPRIPLEGVMAARHPIFVDCSKAVKELGMPQTPIEQTLDKAVSWFRERSYA